MSTADQLLAAIREHPDEDTPRLIFADYYEENDQPERAEFIRVQCEYARVPTWELRSKEIRHRMRVLLARHGRQWYAELPTLKDVKWGPFHRGFIAGVGVPTGKVLVEQANAIREAAPVERVVFTTTEVAAGRKKKPFPWLRAVRIADRDEFQPEQFAKLLEMLPPTLQTLDLGGTGVENAGAEAIANASHLTNLQELDLSDCFVGVRGVTALCGAKHLANLRVAQFSSYGSGYVEDPFLNTEGVEILASRESQLKNLTTLELGQNALTDTAVHALLTSPTLATLEHVVLRWCGMSETAFAAAASPARWKTLDISGHRPSPESLRHLAALPQLSSLVSFHAEGCNLKAEHLSILNEAKFAPGLRELFIQQNGCGPDGIAALVRGSWPNLHTLDLTRNAIGDGVKDLVAGKFTVLTDLRLSNNEIGDSGITALANSEWAGSLRRLRLEQNKILAGGVNALAASPRLRNLTELNLATNGVKREKEVITFGAAGVEALAAGEWPELTDLNLNGAQCGDAGLKVLAASGILDQLLQLSLEHNLLTATGVRALAGRDCPFLRELRLGSNQQIGVDSLTALAESNRFPSLTTLCLTYCNLEAGPLEEFAKSKLVSQLRRLQIYGNKSTQALQKQIGSLHWGYPGPDWIMEDAVRDETW